MVTDSSYGLAFNGEGLQYKLYTPLGEVLAQRRVFNGKGEKVESYVTLKLEKNTEYKIQFWSKKTSAGIFSIELLKSEDKFGETRDQAHTIPAGTPIQYYNMSGWGDIDCIYLGQADHDRTATFSLNNFEFDTNYFKMSLYDSFGIKVASKVCKMGKTEKLTYTLKAGEAYSLEIKVDDEQLWFGKYKFGWCTDSAHVAAGNTRVLKDATCTNAGLQCDTCLICESQINKVEIPMLGHVAGEELIIQPATCIDMGLKEIHCINCNEVLTSEALPMTSHSTGKMEVVKSPTCTEPGLSEQHCTVCNITLSTESPAALGHIPGSVETTTSTCLVEGSKVVHCSVCNEVLSSEPIAKSEHVPGAWVDLREATCTADGQRVQYCAVCNVTLATETVTAFGHSPLDWQTTREAACLQSGLKEKKCSACGLTLESEQINALGHTYSEWETTIEPTKDAEGEQRRHCINCGDTQLEKIEKLPKVLGIF